MRRDSGPVVFGTAEAPNPNGESPEANETKRVVNGGCKQETSAKYGLAQQKRCKLRALR